MTSETTAPGLASGSADGASWAFADGARPTLVERRMVGAVGRASIGFGLAVGRSRAIRPTMGSRRSEFGGAAPALDLWRMRRGDGDVLNDLSVVTTSAPQAGTRVRGAPPPPPARRTVPTTPSGAERAGPMRVRPSATSTRRPQSTRPAWRSWSMWTDQVIARSAVGYVSPAPQAPRPEPDRPAIRVDRRRRASTV